MARITKVTPGRPYRASQLGLNDENDVVWGIFVGGCIDFNSRAWDVWAERKVHSHAHNQKGDEWFGWICILEPSHVLTKTSRPSQTLLHEFAHLLVPNEYHSPRWKKVVTGLGAAREATRVANR